MIFLLPFAIILLDIWALTSFSADNFHRLGSIIVVVSILLLGRSISQHRLTLEAINDLLHTFDCQDHQTQNELKSLDQAAKLREEVAYSVYWLVRIDVFLLVLGTLQWGYGDLFHIWLAQYW